MRLDDPMKSKHLRHALEQLAEEGVTRVFKPLIGGDWIVGVVGALQLDVLAARIKAEYGLATRLDGAPYEAARWLEADDPAELERFSPAQPLGLRRGPRRRAGVPRPQRLGSAHHDRGMAEPALQGNPRAELIGS